MRIFSKVSAHKKVAHDLLNGSSARRKSIRNIEHHRQCVAHEWQGGTGLPCLRHDAPVRPFIEFLEHPICVLADHLLNGRNRRRQRYRDRHAAAIDLQAHAAPPATTDQFVVHTMAFERDAALRLFGNRRCGFFQTEKHATLICTPVSTSASRPQSNSRRPRSLRPVRAPL